LRGWIKVDAVDGAVMGGAVPEARIHEWCGDDGKGFNCPRCVTRAMLHAAGIKLGGIVAPA